MKETNTKHSQIRLIPRRGRRRGSGFALIATIMLMVLIALIAVGMLSLAQVTLRTSGVSQAQMEARANAKVALMMAIAELQKQLGPDQRISANGAILDHLNPANPHWLGVWSSWKAGENSLNSVDGYSEHSTIQGVSSENVHPTYTQGRDDHFLRWLVSSPEESASDIGALNVDMSLATVLPDSGATSVKLIAEGSAGSDQSNHVAAFLVNVQEPSATITGRYGWHVSDSSQKAMLIHHENSQRDDLAQEFFELTSPPGTGYEHLDGFSELENPEQASQIVTLPTLNILDPAYGTGAESLAGRYFHDFAQYSASVLADVRAGGLKSDLNTLLEREIDVTETGDEFMLYKFDDNNRVPIQDLAAFYQLYDHDANWSNGRRGGVEFDSVSDPLQVTVPDAGGENWRSTEVDRYLKAHNAMYLRPIPIKVHYVAGVSASFLTDDDRAIATVYDRNTGDVLEEIDPLDTHRVTIGITPTVSLWNPTNMPMVMDITQIFRLCSPPLGFRWKLYRDGELLFTDWWNNMSACIINESFAGAINPWSPFIANLRLKNESGGAEITFEPGEVKVFSMEVAENERLTVTGEPEERIIRKVFDAKPFWDPYGLQTTTNSGVGNTDSRNRGRKVFKFSNSVSNQHRQLVVREGDELVLEIGNEVANWGLTGGNSSHRMYLGRDMTRGNEVIGSPFDFEIMNETFGRKYEQFRNYQMLSRQGGNWSMRNTLKNTDFGGAIMDKGMPEGTIDDAEYQAVMTDPAQTPRILPAGNSNLKIDVDDVIASAGTGEGRGLFEFFLAAGPEVMGGDSLATGGGKLIPSRPFKHSSIIKPPFISEADDANLYHYGWDWQVRRLNDIEDSSVKIDQATNKGYWGGGYTPEQGVNNVIQLRLPVVPPTSIASLSHALLGGFSIANQGMVSEDIWPYDYNQGRWGTGTTGGPEHPIKRGIGDPLALRRTTAYGNGGLGPFTFQALGDSYAHPNIPAGEAFVTKTFTYKKEFPDMDPDSGPKEVPFADHSYLANKAMWDQFFFSSITGQPERLGVFDSTDRTAKEVAYDFFFEDGDLPNKRFVPSGEMTSEKLDELFEGEELYEGGLADKIARHLMLMGGFNVNSTSITAWKAVLMGLKNERLKVLKPQGSDYAIQDEPALADTPVGVASLQNEGSFSGSDLMDTNSPETQWTGYRTLSDEEIEELAEAIVRQVKLRGPFLSMSDFVNRRLDADDTNLSKYGALQAALDDPEVSINRHFRDNKARTMGGFSEQNVDSSDFAFPEAIDSKDAIAYGSNPYVDQSELLQGIGSQLTVRGDTFVIRAYGDAIDESGQVVARAWCEAEVQRVPEYLDEADEADARQDELDSPANQTYGRRFVISRFHWLSPSEV
ncbi:MAG: hypothetical protein AB8D78_00460 [Akkermansiaceae bacterium]